MAKKINYSDLVEVNSLKAILDGLDKIEVKLKDILTLSGKKVDVNIGSYADVKKNVEAIDNATKAVEQLTSVQKDQIKIREQLKRATEAEEGSYNKIAAQYEAVKAQLRAMGDQQRDNTEAGKKLLAESERLRKEFDRVKQATGQLRGEYGVFKKTVNLAEMSLGDMRKEMMQLRRTSFTGKSEAEIKALKQRIGDLMDAMGDLKAEMKIMGTENAAVLVGGLKFISAGVEGVVGSLSLFGVESKQIEVMQKRLLALMAVTQALSEIEDMVSSGKLRAIAMRIKEMAINVKDTAVKWLNVIATTAQARAEESKAIMVGKGNVLVKGAAAVQWAWNAAIAANPIGLIIVAVAALAAGIYLLVKAQTKSTQAEKDRKIQTEAYSAALKEANESSAKELASMYNIIQEIGKENTSRKKRVELVKELDSKFPGYLSNMEREKLLAGDTATAYDKLSKAIYAKALMNALEDKLAESIKAQFEAEQKALGVKTQMNKAYKENSAAMIALSGINNLYKERIDDVATAHNKTKIILDLLSKSTDNFNNITKNGTIPNYEKLKLIKKDINGLSQAELINMDNYILASQVAENRMTALNPELKKRIKTLEDLNEAYATGAINIYQYRAAAAKFTNETLEESKRLKKIRLEEEQAEREKSLEALDDYFKKVNEKRQRALDREIDNSKRQQDLLRELAARGSEDANKNLAFEEAAQRKLELQKEKAIQRAKMQEIGLAVLKSYSKNIESSGGDSTKALTQTIKDATLLTAFIKSLPAFYGGSEEVSKDLNPTLKGKDGYLIRVDGDEGVLNPAHNKAKLSMGLDNRGLIEAARKGLDASGPGQWQTNKQILAKFDELNETIKNKPSLTGTEYDGITHSIISIIENGNSINRRHTPLSKLG